MKLLLTRFLSLLLIFSISSFKNPNFIITEKYQQGYYIGNTGKVEGYIYFSYDNYEKFSFKKELKDKRSLKRVGEITSFFVDGKTFKVINNLNLRIGIWNISAQRAFAEVMVEGPVNLYKVYSRVGNGNMSNPGAIELINYIVEKDNKKYAYANEQTGKFKREAAELFKDREDIVEKIKNGKYALKNILDLVNDYNSTKI
ncbi:hypothetical protein [Rufibacter tibetensis]|uniref:DUF4369 domain-containing protein n=1 Tax=Rufibacter tibetensis TaxID=512763 RepID=A0A0P0CMU6_9BACT|nr:hypothetical protein [Rufibacter tibetensis]ALI98324.1 hypothetical protein DC20_04145 [Rufibacter tibetensis]